MLESITSLLLTRPGMLQHAHAPAEEARMRPLVADMGVGGSAGPVSMAEPGVRWKMACTWYWKRTEVPLKDGGMPSGSCSLHPC